MIKKVVVAAAGQGTRMLHLTKNKSKHLIRVQEKPFLAYVLDNLLMAGYRELILVVGYKEKLMKDFVKEYKSPMKIEKTIDNNYVASLHNYFARSENESKLSFSSLARNYKITLVSQYDILGPKEKEYGTACPVKCVKDIVANENFLFVCGDNLYSVKDLKEMNVDDNYNYVAGLLHDHPERYGVLITDDGFLKKIVEKPKEYVGNLINTGLYKFTPEVFEKISKIKKSPRGEYEITDAITLLAEEKKVKVREIQDYWLDFGNPADIIKLSRFLKDANNKNSIKKF